MNTTFNPRTLQNNPSLHAQRLDNPPPNLHGTLVPFNNHRPRTRNNLPRLSQPPLIQISNNNRLRPSCSRRQKRDEPYRSRTTDNYRVCQSHARAVHSSQRNSQRLQKRTFLEARHAVGELVQPGFRVRVVPTECAVVWRRREEYHLRTGVVFPRTTVGAGWFGTWDGAFHGHSIAYLVSFHFPSSFILRSYMCMYMGIGCKYQA